jgi:hypothetical protein
MSTKSQINDKTLSFNRICNKSTNDLNEILIVLSNTTHDLNECLMNCSNRGKCMLLNKDQNVYGCICDEDFYAGKSCQIDLRPCSQSGQCLNNGTCINTYLNKTCRVKEFSFECKCGSNFYGQYCELRKEYSSKEMCSSHGRVSSFEDANGKYKCKCFVDYSGEKCEIEDKMIKIIKYAQVSSLTLFLITIGTFWLLIVANDVFNLFLPKPKKKLEIEYSINYQYKYYNRFQVECNENIKKANKL